MKSRRTVDVARVLASLHRLDELARKYPRLVSADARARLGEHLEQLEDDGAEVGARDVQRRRA